MEADVRIWVTGTQRLIGQHLCVAHGQRDADELQGEHWHSARTERRLLIIGGRICFRKSGDAESVEYRVSGQQHTAMQSLAGYIHVVTNIRKMDLIDVVWSGAGCDPQNQDTFA